VQVFSGTFRGKKVAVKKVLSSQVPGSEARLRGFQNELETMWCVAGAVHSFARSHCADAPHRSGLRHPNCVLFIGACLEPQNLSIVMEFCGRGTLHAQLHDKSVSFDYRLVVKVHSALV
jgi:serine/threonine protein kinase